MWNDNSNWDSKGEISSLPETLCCVFWQNQKDKKTMEHIGFYIGGGMMIHCSGTVKKEKLSAKCTHWAIPKGLGGDVPVPTWRPTIRRRSTGDDVVYCQRKLMALNYDLGPSGADGKFGSKTEAAVKAFQRNTGLNPDGVVGPLTWEKLEESVIPGTGLYTVRIQHLSYEESRELKSAYPDAIVTEEAVTGNG